MSTLTHTTTDVTTTTDPIRETYRQAVAEVAANAKAALPACEGRIDKAVALVLAGDVELLQNGAGAKVASQSKAGTVYFAVNGSCSCKDAPKAPDGFCKHRLAYGIAKRAYSLASTMLEMPAAAPAADDECWQALDAEQTPCHAVSAVCPGHNAPVAHPAPVAPVQALPEAPASVNCYVTLAGRQVQITLRDTDEHHLLARLETLLQRFPVEAPATTTPPTTTPATTAEGWCQTHAIGMRLTVKNGDSWYSHKTADGLWCKGHGRY